MNLKQRLQRLIAGQANIVKEVGDIIVGDGQQTVRLKNPNVGGASDGFALVLDSTQPTGVVWSPTTGVAGIMNVTGSDGVTVTTPMVGVRNATNDLVTGTIVAQIDAVTSGDVDIAGSGDVNLLSGGLTEIDSSTTIDLNGQGDVSLTSIGGAVNLTTSVDDINVTSGVGIVANAAGAIDMTAGGSFGITATDAIQINALGAGGFDITLVTGGTGDILINPNHDETHTVGRNFTVNAAGSGGIALDASGGDVSVQAEQTDVIIRAGNVGGTGVVSLQPGTTSANRKFQIFDGDGAGQQTVLGAGGGTVQDLEARNAINGLLDAMYLWGWISNPNP